MKGNSSAVLVKAFNNLAQVLENKFGSIVQGPIGQLMCSFRFLENNEMGGRNMLDGIIMCQKN